MAGSSATPQTGTLTQTTTPPVPVGNGYQSTASGGISTGAPAAPPTSVSAGLGPITRPAPQWALAALAVLLALVGALAAAPAIGRRRSQTLTFNLRLNPAATASGQPSRRWALAAPALVAVIAVASPAVARDAVTHPALVWAGSIPGAQAATRSATVTSPAALTHPASSRVAATDLLAGNVPQRIDIPALGVDAPVDQVTTSATGSLGVPQNPARTGWWSGGAQLGAATGTAALDGHVNYGGTPGAFAGLSRLQPGDVLILSATAGSYKYVVTGLREYRKASLPWSSLFAGDVGARLVLITCGGSFDPATGHYADNVVVFAEPIATPS